MPIETIRFDHLTPEEALTTANKRVHELEAQNAELLEKIEQLEKKHKS